MTRQQYRVFQGKDTKQVYHSRMPVEADRWFYEPADYDGDVIWEGFGYDTKEAAIEAAEQDPDLETEDRD